MELILVLLVLLGLVNILFTVGVYRELRQRISNLQNPWQDVKAYKSEAK